MIGPLVLFFALYFRLFHFDNFCCSRNGRRYCPALFDDVFPSLACHHPGPWPCSTDQQLHPYVVSEEPCGQTHFLLVSARITFWSSWQYLSDKESEPSRYFLYHNRHSHFLCPVQTKKASPSSYSISGLLSDWGSCWISWPSDRGYRPLMAPFFLRDDLTKEGIISTKSSVQTVGHLIKIPVFLSVGFPYMEHILLISILTIAAVIGTRVGVHLLGKINEKVFRVIFRSALFLAAVRLIYKVTITS